MNCIRCERPLKDPWSARAGIGPVCARKKAAEDAAASAEEEEELSDEEAEEIFAEMGRDYNKMIERSLKQR